MTNYREVFSVEGGDEIEKVAKNDEDSERQQRADAWAEKQKKRSREIEKEFSDVSDDELLKLYKDILIICAEESKEEAEEIKRNPCSEVQIKIHTSENVKKIRRIEDELERRGVDVYSMKKEKAEKETKIELSEKARGIKNELLENKNKPVLTYIKERAFEKELDEIKEELEKTYGLEKSVITKILYGDENIETLLGYEKE